MAGEFANPTVDFKDVLTTTRMAGERKPRLSRRQRRIRRENKVKIPQRTREVLVQR